MKIITWNCNGAFRKKLASIDELDADILIIQECEDPARSTQDYRDWAGNYLWRGNNKNKGLGIFSRKNHKITILDWQGEYRIKLSESGRQLKWSSDQLECFLPCKIDDEYTILGVWTKQAKSPNFQYIGQFWLYLQIHKEKLTNGNTFICGDFNSNVIWDECDRVWNHSDVVDELSEKGIHSVYHSKKNEEQGKESEPTFYLHRNSSKPYHIDYIFASKDIMGCCNLLEVERSTWTPLSDHFPLVVTVE